jgi:hypothetical protein
MIGELSQTVLVKKMLNNHNKSKQEKYKVRGQEEMEEVNKAGSRKIGRHKGKQGKEGKEEQKDNLSLNKKNRTSQALMTHDCNPSY